MPLTASSISSNTERLAVKYKRSFRSSLKKILIIDTSFFIIWWGQKKIRLSSKIIGYKKACKHSHQSKISKDNDRAIFLSVINALFLSFAFRLFLRSVSCAIQFPYLRFTARKIFRKLRLVDYVPEIRASRCRLLSNKYDFSRSAFKSSIMGVAITEEKGARTVMAVPYKRH